VTALLLDVDGVLQSPSDDLDAALNAGVRWREGYAAFLADVFTDPAYLATMSGHGEVLAALQPVLDRHTSDLSATRLHDLWCTRIVINEDLLDLLPRLGVEAVWLATNQDARRAAAVATTYLDRPWCTGLLASCDLGVRKPEPQFYRAVLDRLASPADDCFVVDDKAACVEAAATLGIPGATYVDVPTLVTDLTVAGLLVG
jgi:putative hydrolase of the HAD superfamily